MPVKLGPSVLFPGNPVSRCAANRTTHPKLGNAWWELDMFQAWARAMVALPSKPKDGTKLLQARWQVNGMPGKLSGNGGWGLGVMGTGQCVCVSAWGRTIKELWLGMPPPWQVFLSAWEGLGRGPGVGWAGVQRLQACLARSAARRGTITQPAGVGSQAWQAKVCLGRSGGQVSKGEPALGTGGSGCGAG